METEQMTDPDIAAIAQGLTKAQRRSILDAQDMMSNHNGYPFFIVRITCQPWPEGVAQFLTMNTDRLTRDGLRLRQYLQETARG